MKNLCLALFIFLNALSLHASEFCEKTVLSALYSARLRPQSLPFMRGRQTITLSTYRERFNLILNSTPFQNIFETLEETLAPLLLGNRPPEEYIDTIESILTNDFKIEKDDLPLFWASLYKDLDIKAVELLGNQKTSSLSLDPLNSKDREAASETSEASAVSADAGDDEFKNTQNLEAKAPSNEEHLDQLVPDTMKAFIATLLTIHALLWLYDNYLVKLF